MRILLQEDSGKKPLQWSLWVPEAELPAIDIAPRSFHLRDANAFAREVESAKRQLAFDVLMKSEPVQWTKGCGSKLHGANNDEGRFRTDCLMLSGEQALDYGFWLVGVTFRFREKSGSAMFKLAWGNGQGGLIEFKYDK